MSSTEWHDPKVKLPEKGQACLLFFYGQGFGRDRVWGPIDWFTNEDGSCGCWLDIFATPEAGASVLPDQVDLWTLWDPIAPPVTVDKLGPETVEN